jgi:hypothetical protein
MTAQTITASGAAQVGSLTSNGPVNGAEAHITGAVTAASVTASGAVSAGSFSAPVVAASSYVQSSLILSVPDLVFAVGPSTPERMRITAAGNIGIGTANPQHKLQVLSSLGVGSFSGAVAENNVIAINAAGAANYARLAFGTATDLGMGTLFTGMETRTDIGSLDFHVNSSSTAMRITQAGNVGIGTADPWGVLHVNGSCRITLDANGLASNAGLAQFQIAGQSDTTKTLWFGYDTSANVGVIQAGISGIGWSPLLLNPAGGNVGIGTANPQAKLHFFNPSALAANEIGNMIRLDRATPSNTGAAIWNAHDGATDYLAIGAGTGFNPSNNPLLLLKAAGGVAGGTILMFLGGSLKTLSVDGNGFVKAA